MTAEIRPLPASNLAQLPAEAEQGKWLRKLRLDGSDREDKEFLPGHIEILETPAAPLASILIWVVCGVFAAALVWSCIARLDIHAVAAGRVQPSGRSKVVQPFDNSKVVSVLVQNGQKVRAGDLLIELDSTQASAELRSVSGDLESAEAEIARREAAVLAVRTDARAPQPRFPVDVSGPIRAREMTALTADLGQYYSSRGALQAQLSEKDALKLRFMNSTAARERLVKVLRERVEMRETLLASQSGSKAAVIDAVQQLEEQAANLAYEKGQLLEADAAMQSILRQIDQLTDQFIAQQTQKITEVSQQRDRLRETIVKAKSTLSFTQLTAPIDGTVQQLAVTTVGQVVTTGQPLLVLVPAQETVEVEALILNGILALLRSARRRSSKSIPFRTRAMAQYTVKS